MSLVHIFFEGRTKRFSTDNVQLTMAYAETRRTICQLVDDLNRLESRKRLFDPTFVIIFFGFLVLSAYLCLYFWYLFELPIIFFVLIIVIVALSVCRWAQLRRDVQRVVMSYQQRLGQYYSIQSTFSHHNSNRIKHPALTLIPLHDRPVVVAPVAVGQTQASFIPIFDYGNQSNAAAYNTFQQLQGNPPPGYQMLPPPQPMPMIPPGQQPQMQFQVAPIPNDYSPVYQPLPNQIIVTSPQYSPVPDQPLPPLPPAQTKPTEIYQVPLKDTNQSTIETNRRSSIHTSALNDYKIQFSKIGPITDEKMNLTDQQFNDEITKKDV